MQVLSLNRQHEVKDEEKEIPNQVERDTVEAKAFSKRLILSNQFNLVKHDEKSNHDQ